MKILFLYDFPLWGSGSGRYIRHTIEELIKLNYKIGIICPEERRFLEEKIKHYKVSPPQIPVYVAHPELKGAKRYSELSEREITEIYKSYLDTTIEAVANFQPDLIHCHHLSLISWVARYMKALKRIPYIITSHGSCLYHILADKRYLSLCGDALRGAKAITVVSGDTKSKIVKIFGRELEKSIYIIPGGISASSFPNGRDTSALDEKYQIKDKKIVMFSGRLISHKGVKYLVKAAGQIKGEVFIIGEGPEKEYLKEFIERKGLKNVHLLGYIEPHELIDFYYRANVFVAPSVWDEPLGLSILEAMAAKTPVVATRKGGIPLLIKEGINGFFVPARNAKEIAKACNKILEDEQLEKKMGESARQRVLQKFTWKHTAQKFNRLYKRLLKK